MSSESDAVIDLYQRHAGQFDADRDRSLFEKTWLDRFLALAPAGGSVLDCGCGVGEPIARYVIACGFHLTGIDSSPAMIALCQSRFPAQTWITADLRVLSLNRQVDAILAWDSFFFLTHDEQRAMFPVFAAHMPVSAPLMFNSGSAFGQATGSYCGEALRHFSLGPDEYRSLLAANGFSAAEYSAEDQSCGGRTIWLARKQ